MWGDIVANASISGLRPHSQSLIMSGDSMEFGEYKLGVQIMHKINEDQKRQVILRELQYDLREMGFEFGVTLDRNNSHLDTAISSYVDALSADSTHLMVLEDDVCLHSQFAIITQMAISARPKNILSFFGISKKLETAYRDHETNWVEAKTCSWNQCYVIPATKIGKIIDFSNEYAINDHAFDCILSVWCLLNNERIFILTPTPLEHTGFERSMLGHSAKIGKIQRTSGFLAKTMDQYHHLDKKPFKLSGLKLKDYNKYVDLERIKEDYPNARI